MVSKFVNHTNNLYLFQNQITRNAYQHCVIPAEKSLEHLISCKISRELLKDTY